MLMHTRPLAFQKSYKDCPGTMQFRASTHEERIKSPTLTAYNVLTRKLRHPLQNVLQEADYMIRCKLDVKHATLSILWAVLD
jgi:hypothetical protein